MKLKSTCERPSSKAIIPPLNGWKEQTYYKVEASFNRQNPISEYIFYSGFLNGKNGEPGGYNQIWNGSMEDFHTINDVYYMKVIGELTTK